MKRKLPPQKNTGLSVDSTYHLHQTDSINLEAYSTLDIVKNLDISRERLRDWQNREFIDSSVKASGQGTRALFSRLDVYTIALFRYMVEICKFSREEAACQSKIWRQEVKIPRENETDLFGQICFLRRTKKDGSQEILLKPHKIINSSRKENIADDRWDSLFIVNFKKIKKQVDSQLA
jgi:hypothetical protein